jgi:hypothetical protein
MRGVVGIFPNLDDVVHAVEELKKGKYRDVTVYTPTPRHEIEHAVHAPNSPVRRFTLIGGILGCTFGYWIAVWTSDYWPLVVGGKAVASWVPYTIFGFEVMVLVGGLSTVFGMFALARVPRLTQTVGYDERFTHGDYGIWVEAEGDQVASAEALLRKHGAAEVRHAR